MKQDWSVNSVGELGDIFFADLNPVEVQGRGTGIVQNDVEINIAQLSLLLQLRRR